MQNENIDQLLTNDSFVRWIKGEAGRTEKQSWEKWLEEDPARSSKISEAKKLYHYLQFEEEVPNTMSELNRLRKTIDIYETHHKSAGRKLYHWSGAAAVAVILLSITLFFQYGEWATVSENETEEPVFSTVETRNGQLQNIRFPDGSSIVLNANSTLAYPESFTGLNIELKLQGEAYFDITSTVDDEDRRRNFSIETPDGRVTVLGTSFNINARQNKTEVVLESGSVRVETGYDTIKGKPGHSYVINPGEMARFTSFEQGVVVEEVETELYTSWINLELKFRNTPLSEIAERIRQTYGVEVIFANEELKNIRFSGTAPNQNLSVLLEGLRTLLKEPITEEVNRVVIGEAS